MLEVALPVALAAFAWWFATGAILWLDRRPRGTYRWSMIAATALAAASLAGYVEAAGRDDAAGAYLGFASALGVWAWHELSFLTGFLTGPRRAPCPPGARGWRRFCSAAATLAYHEAAIVGTALALAALSWGGENQTGLYTFLILFGMRISAKLNIFLGVPNFSDELLPDHLDYLRSYFRKRPFNPIFPASIAAAAALATALALRLLAAEPGGGAAVGAALLLALTALAAFEHLMMITPFPDAVLWRWAMPAGRGKR